MKFIFSLFCYFTCRRIKSKVSRKRNCLDSHYYDIWTQFPVYTNFLISWIVLTLRESDGGSAGTGGRREREREGFRGVCVCDIGFSLWEVFFTACLIRSSIKSLTKSGRKQFSFWEESQHVQKANSWQQQNLSKKKRRSKLFFLHFIKNDFLIGCLLKNTIFLRIGGAMKRMKESQFRLYLKTVLFN